MLRLIALQGVRAHKTWHCTFTKQVKRYMSGLKPYYRAFITIGKQTISKLNTSTKYTGQKKLRTMIYK